MDLDEFRRLIGRELTLEDHIIYVLLKVYQRADWRRIARGRDPLDVFQHRVLAASYQPLFTKFLERLCLSLGIQSVRIESSVLDVLRSNERRALEMLRENSIYYVAKMYDIHKRAREMRAQVKQGTRI